MNELERSSIPCYATRMIRYNNYMELYSTFLTATPTLLEAGRILDIGSTFDDYNTSSNPDTLALSMDLQVVGLAFWKAFIEMAASLSSNG